MHSCRTKLVLCFQKLRANAIQSLYKASLCKLCKACKTKFCRLRRKVLPPYKALLCKACKPKVCRLRLANQRFARSFATQKTKDRVFENGTSVVEGFASIPLPFFCYCSSYLSQVNLMQNLVLQAMCCNS